MKVNDQLKDEYKLCIVEKKWVFPEEANMCHLCEEYNNTKEAPLNKIWCYARLCVIAHVNIPLDLKKTRGLIIESLT